MPPWLFRLAAPIDTSCAATSLPPALTTSPVLSSLRLADWEPSAPEVLSRLPTLAVTLPTAASDPFRLSSAPAASVAVPAADIVPPLLSSVPDPVSTDSVCADTMPPWLPRPVPASDTACAATSLPAALSMAPVLVTFRLPDCEPSVPAALFS
ncbi:hypothetical protein LMG9673_01100 [Ralstonia pseudosolanacearum]|nr:hypothetical protein LMG9673_01100 [Ralstonia pseudosolanacearum]